MTRYKLIITPRAQLDVRRILQHVAAKSPQDARSVAASFANAISALLDTPKRGVVPGQPVNRRDPVRCTSAGNYSIFFRAIDRTQTVRVVRVRHAKRRPLKRYG